MKNIHSMDRRCGLTLVVWILATACSWAESAPSTPPLDQKDGPLVYVLPIQGVIDLGMPHLVRRGIQEAQQAQADFLILDMKTPGGRGDVMEEIIDLVMSFEPREGTITYVNNEAGSAGAIIAAATRSIYMSERAIIGAATPVIMGEGGPVELPEKFLSFYSAKARSLAEVNGHIPEVFEGMVRKESGVVINGEVIVEKGNIVTFTTEQATRMVVVEDGQPARPLLAKGMATTLEELIEKVAGPNARVVKIEPSLVEQISVFIVSIAPLLIAVAFIGGYIEFQTPGFGVAGIVAIVCLLVAFFGHYVGGMTGYESIILIGLGVGLILVEIIFPGLLLPGFAGVFALLIGLILLLAEPGIAPPSGAGESVPGEPWRFPVLVLPSPSALAVAMLELGLAALIALVGIAFAARYLPRAKFLGGITLVEEPPWDQGQTSPELPPLGTRVVVVHPLRPSGTIEWNGKIIAAQSEGEWTQAGQTVEVTGHRAGKVIVCHIKE